MEEKYPSTYVLKHLEAGYEEELLKCMALLCHKDGCPLKIKGMKVCEGLTSKKCICNAYLLALQMHN